MTPPTIPYFDGKRSLVVYPLIWAECVKRATDDIEWAKKVSLDKEWQSNASDWSLETMKHLRDTRPIGSRIWFEYHCYEGHDSADAAIWYRSHQQVTISDIDETCDAVVCGILTRKERDEGACSLMYRVRFDDGHEATVFEDELLDSPTEYYRPNPPIAA